MGLRPALKNSQTSPPLRVIGCLHGGLPSLLRILGKGTSVASWNKTSRIVNAMTLGCKCGCCHILRHHRLALGVSLYDNPVGGCQVTQQLVETAVNRGLSGSEETTSDLGPDWDVIGVFGGGGLEKGS